MKDVQEAATRERVLDVAERLFAEHGYAEASIRRLAAEAGVNLGAVNYHFVTKEALYLAVLTRRFDDVHRRRVERLAAAVAEVRGGVLEVRVILDCILGPAFETAVAHPHFPKLLARNIFTPPAFANRVMDEALEAMFHLFIGPLRRSLPAFSIEQLALKMRFTGGALLFLATMEEGDWGGNRASWRESYSRLLEFTTAGFLAGPGEESP